MSRDTYAKLEAGGDTRTTKLRALATAFSVPLEVVLQVQFTGSVAAVRTPQATGTEDMASMKASIEALRREVADLRGDAPPQSIQTGGVEGAYDALEADLERHEREERESKTLPKRRMSRLSKKKRAR